MKFDQVVLTGASESIVLFDHKQPRSTPYTARSIDGLGPTDVDVTLAQTSQGAGIYIGRREQLREITANVFSNPNYFLGQTPEALREAIYLMRPSNEDLSLDFRLLLEGVEVAMTPVYVKRVEVTPFSKDTALQIVLASTSAYFYRREPVVLTDPVLDKTNPIFVNEGTVESGFKLDVLFTGTVTSFGLEQSAPSSKMEFKKAAAAPSLFVAGDLLEVDTNIGSRGIWITRGGVRTPAMNILSPESTWLKLYPGENELTTLIEPASTTSYTWKRLEHTVKYKGV